MIFKRMLCNSSLVPQICVMNCSEREMCGSVIVEGSEIDRVGRGRGRVR